MNRERAERGWKVWTAIVLVLLYLPIVSIVLASLAMGMTVLIPWLVGRTIDEIASGDTGAFVPLALAIVAAGLIRLALTAGRRVVAGKVSLADLARFPNLWLKVSSHVLHAADQAGSGAPRVVAWLAEHFCERLIWGSDYPHLSFADKVGSVELFNLLADWADEAQRRKILVDNPQRLFGF